MKYHASWEYFFCVGFFLAIMFNGSLHRNRETVVAFFFGRHGLECAIGFLYFLPRISRIGQIRADFVFAVEVI